MKKFLNIFAVMLMASVFALGLVSCSNDSDDDSDVAAEYTATGSYATYTLTCYSDNTFILAASASGKSFTFSKGTYKITSGDFTNGTLVITANYVCRDESLQLEKLETAEVFETTITNGSFTVKNIEGDNTEVTFTKK